MALVNSTFTSTAVNYIIIQFRAPAHHFRLYILFHIHTFIKSLQFFYSDSPVSLCLCIPPQQKSVAKIHINFHYLSTNSPFFHSFPKNFSYFAISPHFMQPSLPCFPSIFPSRKSAPQTSRIPTNKKEARQTPSVGLRLLPEYLSLFMFDYLFYLCDLC